MDPLFFYIPFSASMTTNLHIPLLPVSLPSPFYNSLLLPLLFLLLPRSFPNILCFASPFLLPHPSLPCMFVCLSLFLPPSFALSLSFWSPLFPYFSPPSPTTTTTLCTSPVISSFRLISLFPQPLLMSPPLTLSTPADYPFIYVLFCFSLYPVTFCLPYPLSIFLYPLSCYLLMFYFFFSMFILSAVHSFILFSHSYLRSYFLVIFFTLFSNYFFYQ